MSLMTYDEARPWAKSIEKAVVTRTMPPFHAAGPIGRYENDLRLTDDQIRVIRDWVDRGARRGDPSDAPSARSFDDTGWKMGEPDLVLSFPAIKADASKQDYRAVLYHDYTFDTDIWLQGIEFAPSQRKYVHHAGIFAVPSEQRSANDVARDVTDEEMDFLLSGTPLVTWLPGAGPFLLKDGQGLRIEEGSRIALQIHLAPYGEAFTEVSRIGFKFVDGVVRENTDQLVTFPVDLVIPPGDPEYELRTKNVFRRDATVHSFQVHMHLRGKSSKVIFHYNDRPSETVFEMPEYNFDWQRYYRLEEPLHVSKGVVAEFVAVWDNSDKNPLNPDPTREIHWGTLTTDEMHTNAVLYSWKRETPLVVKKGIPVSADEATEEDAG